MSDLQSLKEKRDFYYRELEELHIYEPSEEWYKTRRYELEAQICFIEEIIDELEKHNKRKKDIVKYLFIGLGIVLLIELILLL
jgi:hypothetical protein